MLQFVKQNAKWMTITRIVDAVGTQQKDGLVCQISHQIEEQGSGGTVGPMHILDNDNQGSMLR
jgi:hypothetical protein